MKSIFILVAFLIIPSTASGASKASVNKLLPKGCKVSKKIEKDAYQVTCTEHLYTEDQQGWKFIAAGRLKYDDGTVVTSRVWHKNGWELEDREEMCEPEDEGDGACDYELNSIEVRKIK